MYVRDVKSGTTNSKDEPAVLKDMGATALVDGKNLLGIDFSIMIHFSH